MNDMNCRFWPGVLVGLFLMAGTAHADTKIDSTRVTANENGHLSDSTAMLLSAVVVTAKSPEDHIMKIDLNRIPLNTTQDLLRKVPGLFIAQHAGGGKAEQIFLRGFDNDHGTDISISTDGMPVNIVSHAHGQGYSDLHFLIPETVENISFGKGSYYAGKGDFNTSGYVDFHTYDRLKNNMVRVERGSFNTLRAVGLFNVVNTERSNAYVAAEYNFTDGPFDVKQNLNRLNLFGKVGSRISEQDSISITGSTFTSNWNGSGQIPVRAVSDIGRFGSVDMTEGGHTSRTNLILNWNHRINDHSGWQNTFYYAKYDFELFSDFTFYLVHPDAGDEIQQTDNRDIYGTNFQYHHHIDFANSTLQFSAGTGFRYDNIHELGLSYVTQRETLNERLAWGTASETNLNAFASASWLVGRWNLNPGLRFDWFNFSYYDKLIPQKGQQGAQAARVSPKLNVFYNVNPTMQVFIKSGLGFHSNDVRAVVAQNGKEILPYSVGADLGTIWTPAPGFIFIPTLWYSFLQNEYIWNGDSYGTSAIGSTRRLGVDLTFRYQPFHWLYLDSDVNLARPRLTGEERGNDYVDLAPTMTSTGGIAFTFNNGFTANLRYRYMHDRPATQDKSIIANGYFVNDLIMSYQKKAMVLSFQIQNLFDTKWNEAMFAATTRLKGEPAGGYDQLTFTPGTPFFLKAGVAFRF
ncbi:TonB-dependent receptor [Dyadobacter jiangsuensis]|uniref:Outer membrane receptor protein involved in Fe transport n=1 Tax=Dyadobacter jiangsuensis TaxID=1591085 RepID=A0A2P8GIN2_9BACT|nr:TonB-dependent receptor plug domain-containing protein [Dyadobacter jiangsuensis]PSL33832.1 outer membrane receptor protein involved in Fe transport [Dyadobacter jiangsuensis]